MNYCSCIELKKGIKSGQNPKTGSDPLKFVDYDEFSIYFSDLKVFETESIHRKVASKIYSSFCTTTRVQVAFFLSLLF